MNEEKLKRIVLQQKIATDDEAKQQVITEGKQLMEQQQYTRQSFFSLLEITLRFIPATIWIRQIALFIGIVSFLVVIQHEGYSDSHNLSILMAGLTVLVSFSLLLFTDELLKSFSQGTWELEQTLKYNLDQQLLAKFLLFGLFELVFIIGISLIGQGFLMLAFWKCALYLLVPMNCCTIVVLSVLTSWNTQSFRILLWLVSGASVVVIWGVLNKFDLYEANISIWIISFLATSLIVTMIILKSTRRIGREMT
ncbi:hypothetical protein [Candidatus Enterococcus ferrettii]|uniref:ABC transporter permease n=1 Tax=Candidatus Enterococcus ferrettii TaxID=2815324 RepID=A0ABV0EUY3_9ENTE|nr:hypothetical protein [Enterococcus sp. 665A]MBO1341679.1 hypothetical protein [Enterococcus sp. 665A]